MYIIITVCTPQTVFGTHKTVSSLLERIWFSTFWQAHKRNINVNIEVVIVCDVYTCNKHFRYIMSTLHIYVQTVFRQTIYIYFLKDYNMIIIVGKH